MKRFIHLTLCFLLIFGTSDLLARKGSSSRSSSSRSSSRSSSIKRSAPKPAVKKSTSPTKSRSTTKSSSIKSSSSKKPATSTVKKSTSTTKSREATKPSSIKSSKKSTSSTKAKAVSTSKLSKKKQKAMAVTNNASAKKYGTKANAEKAFREKMSSSNKYTSSTPPSSRPDYVPQSVTINNNSISTRYDRLPGGGYAYGYHDPVTNMFVAVAAHQMMVNNATLYRHGYGSYNNSGQPVIVRTGSSAGLVFVWIFICIIVAGVVIFVIVKK